MAYSKQVFSTGSIFTATQANQIETNIADHVHGANSVSVVSFHANAMYAGWVGSGGSFVGPSGWTASRVTTGTYNVTHSLATNANSRRWVTIATADAETAGYTGRTITADQDNSNINFWVVDANGALVDSAFWFMMMRNLYN